MEIATKSTIHVQTWGGSCTARITDMMNAGKRGKRCRVLRFSGCPWGTGQGTELQQLAKQFTNCIMHALIEYAEGRLSLLSGQTFDEVREKIRWEVQEARNAGVPATYVEAYDDEIRGVDAPVAALTHVVEGVFGASADEGGVSLSAHNDPYNEWREITPSSQSKGQAYRLAAKVWTKVKECRTLSEASNVLRDAGCRLHGYCAMD